MAERKSASKSPKISLYKYVTGQLDIPAIRASMGLSPIPPRQRALLEKYGITQETKAKAATKKEAAGTAPANSTPAKKGDEKQNEKDKDSKDKDKDKDKDKEKEKEKDKKEEKVAEATTTTFTAAEDARLLEWKAANEGKPWKPLGEELGKSDSALKARFKELKAAGATPEQPAEPVQAKTEDKEKGDANTGKKRDGGEGKVKLEVKDEELIQLLLKEDEDDKWLRIASRFFDKTGRNLHADEIKDKFAKK